MSGEIQTPAVVPAMPFPDYLADPGLGSSELGKMAESPADCKWYRDHGSEETAATGLGTLVHAILAGDAASYMGDAELMPEGYKKPRATKDYAEAVSKAEGAGLVVVKQDAYDKATRMADHVLAHPKAGPLIRGAVAREESYFWHDQGHRCKARADIRGEGWLGDFKTTSRWDRWLPYDFTKYGVYRQAAWYLRGARACGLDVSKFFIVLISSGVIPKVRVGYIDELWLKAGEEEAGQLFAQWRECMASGKWPGDIYTLDAFEGTDTRLAEIFPEENTR